MSDSTANDTQIFLSYAEEDRDRVAGIVRALEQLNWRVFWDQGIASGALWETVLEAELEQAYAVIVVWSKSSVESKWVAREAAAGLAKNRLFPVRIDRDIKIPSPFDPLQAVDLSAWHGDPHDSGFQRVVSIIDELYQIQHGTSKPVKTMRRIAFKSRPAE